MSLGPIFAYYSSVVEIIDNHRNTIGVGTIIDDKNVLTCAHVVGQCIANDPNAPNEAVPVGSVLNVRRSYIESRNATPKPARVRQYHSRMENDAVADIALIELEGDRFSLEGPASITAFSYEPAARDDEVFAIGFPADANETRGGAAEARYRIGGPQPNQWIALTDVHGYGNEIRPGFSGAPVWSNIAKSIVGLITEADAGRRTATLIPTKLLQLVSPVRVIPQPVKVSRTNAFTDQVSPGVRFSLIRTILDATWPSFHYFLTVRLKCLNEPPERQIFARYLANTAAELSDRLNAKTYIPPIAAEPPKTPPMLWRRSGSTVRQLIRETVGLSVGGDSASAQISALSRRSRRIRRLIQALLHTDRPLILLGEPGSGKSITLQQVMMLLSYLNTRRVMPVVCIYLSLGKLKPVPTPGIDTVENFVRDNIPDALRPYLTYLEQSRRLIIIFDGMDEMSRERYVEHTAALAEYAESRRGDVRTLFSCRIADFSPNFWHRRLLLLPFDRAHIAAYIVRQFGSGLIEIDGEKLRAKALAKSLASEDITLQAGNPFVLWLLCLYIYRNQRIPANRTSLLQYYYEYMYSEKLPTLADELSSPWNCHPLFDLWGEIAFELTIRNQGIELSMHDINLLLGNDAADAVIAGRICGVIQQSFGDEISKIRFEHHRAQEYFTAWKLVRSPEGFDWDNKLDVPRWQETLVNVAQMGAGADALDVLSRSLRGISEQVDGEVDKLETYLRESLISERVEVTGRIARELPITPRRAELWNDVVGAVRWLLKEGNAVSKIRALRLVQQNPEYFTVSELSVPLTDTSSWVRDQAQTVAAVLSTDIASSPLPVELIFGFTRGTLWGRWRTFLRIAKTTNKVGLSLLWTLGSALSLAQAGVFALIGIWGIQSIRTQTAMRFVDNPISGLITNHLYETASFWVLMLRLL